MSLEQLISTYGYAAIAIGTFLEGETVLVLGGFAAHQGYLELPWVLASAFLGALSGDQLYFYIGRIRGHWVLEKRPHWKSKSEKIFSLLIKHQVLLILGFRFLYGLRTVTPFVLGAGKVSPFRFMCLDMLGTFTWAVVIGLMGYLFGQALQAALGNIRRYELWIFLGLAMLGVIIWSAHFLWKRLSGGKPPTRPAE